MKKVLILCAAAAVSLGAQQKKPVTLEAMASNMGRMMVMMMGGGGGLWAPDGQRMAVNRGDKLVIYDAATGTEKEILQMSSLTKLARPVPAETAMGWENRRVRDQRMQWSNDGKKMLIMAGGDVFLWSEESGKAEQLTATSDAERDAKLSPDGSKVSFRRGAELFVLDAASKRETRLTFDSSATRFNAMLDWVYPEELDLGTAYWWAPDSKSIAYLQFDVSRETMYPHGDYVKVAAVSEPQRYPKAGTPNADVRVGVVSALGGETRWMDLGETRDFLVARLHWTPDSKSVVVHRLNRVQDHLWVLAADASTGRAQLLIEEKDPSWINITDDFQFLSNGQILRSSESDGFRHLYIHNADGKLNRRLTKGDWEVSAISCVDEKAKLVYFTSTETSPLDRQLFSVGLDGKGKKQITKGDGSHSISMSPTCSYFLDTYSSLEKPSRTTLNKGDGAEVKVWREADTKLSEEYDILKTEIHKFKGADGTQFYGRMIKPVNFDAQKKYPVIVAIYGGPHAQSVRNSWAGSPNWDQVMAHKGFLIWQMDNRGSSGRGHKFETPLYRRMGKTELEDQLEGIKYLATLGYADTSRVGVQGWSYGGYMTLYCLLQAPDVFKAGAAGAAVTDWRNYDTIYTERYMGVPQENEQGYKASSPVNAAANLKGKLLLIHNIEDDNVLFGNAMQMMNALQMAGKSYQTLIYPGKSHGLMGKASQHRYEEQTTFFEDALT
ncbi:MAG: S9 family peptidase [Acidobacteria bacterium]|nr:S9 family peptidase [Acidobacteriota bacterium]